MSIFDDKSNKVSSQFFHFKAFGDAIEGTLINRYEAPNTLRNGEMQKIYVIKTATGDVFNVGGKFGIDQRMLPVKLGQIVGFRYESDMKAKQPGHSPTKIIEVYQSPKHVDQKWLDENCDIDTAAEFEGHEPKAPASASNGPTVDDIPFDSCKPAPPVVVAPQVKVDLLPTIIQLAVSKLGATEANYEKLVMEKTGLAFIEVNYPKIIAAL